MTIDNAQCTMIEDEELFERLRLEVDKGQEPLRIDRYLSVHMAGTSRNRIQTAADAGHIWVNGKPVANNYKVKPNDVIQVLLDHEPHDFTIQPENIPLTVVYEDADLLVVNKPAGLVVHPGHGNYEHTLLNALAWYFKDSLDINDPNIGLVHRIDKDTSGLLLIAKTPEAKTALALQFFEHTTERTYNALVWGSFKEDSGTFSGARARDMRDRTLYKVYDIEDHPEAKEAVTHWRVLERFLYVTLVECRLETGRTHQIRVHMKHIGHPLVGDYIYNPDNQLMNRQALHCSALSFTHPITSEILALEAPMPNDINKIIHDFST